MNPMMVINTALFFFGGCIWSKEGTGNVLVKLGFFLLVAANVICMTWGVK